VHRLRDALSRPILVVTVISIAAGYGQFGAVAALGDVATAFGHTVHNASITEQAGLSGTLLGVGLAVLRLASLGGLPLAALADRLGRHRTLVGWTAIGLAATIVAAASPSYWWFVVLFALGRPFLSASAALAQVVVAELSRPDRRAMALAVVTGGYGLGAGINALAHSALRGIAGFRFLFLTAAIPLVVVLVLRKQFPEPAEQDRLEPTARLRFASVGAAHRTRLFEVLGLVFVTSAVTSPASSFVYLYAENVVHLPKGIESAMITVAALFGLGGLLVGRVVADRFGRRPAVAIGIVAVGLAALVLYAGGKTLVVIGYLVGILATGFLAPGGTALSNELFPTEVRASVAGWGIVAGVLGAVLGLLTFGALADGAHSFDTAALVTFLPTLPALYLLLRLPETKGTTLIGTLGADDLSGA
jgi:MFS family permease